MRVQTGLVLLLCLLACVGCSNRISTDELIRHLKLGTEIEGVKAGAPCRGEGMTQKRSFRR